MQGRPVLSSLPLQIFIWINVIFVFLFFIGEILLMVYKTATLPFPPGLLARDIVLLFVLVGVESLWIVIGAKGNLTENAGMTIFSFLWLIPSILLVLYYILWQTYVMRIDQIICFIMLALHGFQLLFALIALGTFSRSTTI